MDIEPLAAAMKAAAAWQKGLVVPTGGSRSALACRLTSDGTSLQLLARGQHGWLADSVEGRPDDDALQAEFSIGVEPDQLCTLLAKARSLPWLELSVRDCDDAITSGEFSDNGLCLLLSCGDEFEHRPLLDGGAGFWPGDSCPELNLQAGEPDWSMTLAASQLVELLKLSLFAAADPAENQARAVIVAELDEEQIQCTATDGRTVLVARSVLTAPLEVSRKLVLPVTLAERVLGVTSLADDSDQLTLTISGSGQKRLTLRLSCESATVQLLAQLPELQGPDLTRLAGPLRERQHLATFTNDGAFRDRISLHGQLSRLPLTLAGTDSGLVATTRTDTDAAEKLRRQSIVLPVVDSAVGSVTLEADGLLKLLSLLRGAELSLSVATNGFSEIAVIETTEAADVELMAAVVGLNVTQTVAPGDR